MASPSLETTNVFFALAAHAELASMLADAVVDGRWSGTRDLGFICKASGIPLSRQGAVEKALVAGSGAGFCRRASPMSWEPVFDVTEIQQLANMLRGAALYRNDVHKDRDKVEVVLTRPPQPSRLEQALRDSGYTYFGLENTGETFEDMAAQASKRFVVMTPFLDKPGAAALLSLFSRVRPAVRREVVLRFKDANTPPDGLPGIESAMKSLGVAAYHYRLGRSSYDGFETFHAKVVLVDDIWAYAGSANMTQWSLDYSMELGFTVKGEAASRVGNIIDAIIKISPRIF